MGLGGDFALAAEEGFSQKDLTSLSVAPSKSALDLGRLSWSFGLGGVAYAPFGIQRAPWVFSKNLTGSIIRWVGVLGVGAYLIRKFHTENALGDFLLETRGGFLEEQPSRHLSPDKDVMKSAPESSSAGLPPPLMPQWGDLNEEVKQVQEPAKGQAAVASRLASMEAFYHSLSVEDVRERLLSYVAVATVEHIQPESLLKDMSQYFSARKKTSSCGVLREMRQRYLFLSKIIMKESAPVAGYVPLLGCSASTLRNDWITLKRFLKNYQPKWSSFSGDLSRVDVESGAVRKKVSAPSLNTEDLDQLIKDLRSRFLSLDVAQLRFRLAPYISSDVLANIDAVFLLSYLEKRLSSRGMLVFFSDFLQIKDLAYLPQIARYQSLFEIKKRIQSLLQRMSLKNIHTHGFDDFVAEVEDAYQDLGEHRILAVADRYHIARSHRNEFLHQIKKIIIKYKEEKAILMDYYVFMKNILELRGFSYQKIADAFGKSYGGGGSSKSKAKNNSIFRSEITKDLHFRILHLPRFFSSRESLLDYQRNMLNKISREEHDFSSLDYRWNHGSPNDLGHRLQRFLSEEGLTEDDDSELLLYVALGLPKISWAHLGELLGLSEQDALQRSKELYAGWKSGDLTHSLQPSSYGELKRRFLELSEEEGVSLKNRLFSRISSKEDEFLDAVEDFFHFSLPSDLHRHLFLSFTLKMEQPSRLVSENIFKTHGGLKNQETTKEWRKQLRAYTRQLQLRFQKEVLDLQPQKKNKPPKPRDRHQLMVDTYNQISRQELQHLALKWGYESVEEVAYFARRLHILATYLQNHNPQGFDILISRVLHLVPLAMHNVHPSSVNAANMLTREKKIIWKLRSYLQNQDESLLHLEDLVLESLFPPERKL